MNKKKILICGDRSFAANGLEQILKSRGHIVECFSRGEISKNGNIVRGDVYDMCHNTYLGEYDVVINFIIIKDGGVDENIKYAESLIKFCRQKNVKALFQISSISVYPNAAHYINEDSKIEQDHTLKGGYASIKTAVDNYMLAVKDSLKVVFIRPGFIVSKDREISFVGIIKTLPFGLRILLGSKETSLPLIEKDRLHLALSKIVESDEWNNVYLILENVKGTKKDFVQNYSKYRTIPLPKHLVLSLSLLFYKLRLFSKCQVSQVVGLFKDTYFDSSESEYHLKMSFLPHSIAVIGSGAYGAYTIQTLIEAGISSKCITLIDVGNKHLENEDGIGYGSVLTGSNYTGLKKGRFFGFGGASGKWGGQLLMFTQNDFKDIPLFMRDIVELNLKYRDKVFRKFQISNPFNENFKSNGLFTKTGVWLGYFSRNLFSYFKISKARIFIKKGLRVSKVLYKGNTINGIELLAREGKISHGYYDQYFMCAGAFESNRIILSSNLCNTDHISFSDHLSQKVFEVIDKPVIGGEDFRFKVKNTSLITKRLIGEVNGVSFFANPIYNSEFPFFKNLKKVMFKGELDFGVIKSILSDIPDVLKFVWWLLVRKTIYVYKGIWNIYIDIENPSHRSYIKLSDKRDQWGLNKLEVFFEIPQEANDVYASAKCMIESYLKENKVNYQVCVDRIHADKSEDTYHPYGMYLSDSKSIDDYFDHFQNMLMVNTGILPRAGGINTTASCFPIIEEYIVRRYGTSKK